MARRTSCCRASAVEIVGPLSGAGVPQGEIAVHVHHTRADGVKLPVEFVFRIQFGADQTPIGVRAKDRHLHAADGVYDLAEAVEIHHGHVIDGDSQIVLNGIAEKSGASAGVMVEFTILVSGIQALHPDRGNVDPHIPGQRNHGDFAGARADNRDHHRVCSEVGTSSCVGTQQDEVDRIAPGDQGHGGRDL